MPVKISVVLITSMLMACEAEPVIPAQDVNVLHENVGKCGHEGEPCCLQQDYSFDSFCTNGGTCVGASLACTETDGDDGTVGPECGVCGDPDKKYQDFCDAAFLFIHARCQWEADCGFFSQDFVPTCEQWYGAIAEGRCGTPITSSDAKIDACLSEWDGFTCADRNGLPPDCDMFFFSNEG